MNKSTVIEFNVMIVNSENDWETLATCTTQDKAKRLLYQLEEKGKIIMRETIINESELIKNY